MHGDGAVASVHPLRQPYAGNHDIGSHPVSPLYLPYYLRLSLPAYGNLVGQGTCHDARCRQPSRCALQAVSSICQQCTAGTAQQASKKRSSEVGCSTSMPQSARPAQATSYAQLRQARQNSLRHSTGTLKEVLSRSTQPLAANAQQSQ